MKKLVCLMLVALMIALPMAGFAESEPETVTAQKSGYQNIPFSNGYTGFCIDYYLDDAYSGEHFTIAESTAVATNNTDHTDISQPVKVLFTQFFDEVFESDNNGSYKLKDANFIHTIIYGFSDDRYLTPNQTNLANRVKAYSESSIPDHGYSLTLENGDVVTFDFIVLVPKTPTVNSNGQPKPKATQHFFAYKITTTHPTTPQIHNVTATTEGNGTVNSSAESAKEGDEITLTIIPGENSELDTVTVAGETVTPVLGNDGKYTYTFTMPDSDVEVLVKFKDKVIPPTVYTVTVSNDGNGTGSAAPSSGVTGTEVVLSATPNDGYRFKEWQVISGGVTVADNKLTIGTENVEVKAIFEPIPPETFPLTFDPNGGTGSMAQQTFTDGVEQNLTPNAFTKEGYEFTGWNTKPDGTGTPYTDRQLIGITEPTTLYAQWKEVHTCSGGTPISKDPTCTENGHKPYYDCTCGKHYEDEECKTEITDLDSWKQNEGKIPAGHEFGDWVYEDSDHIPNEESHWKECGKCGEKTDSANHVFENDTDTTCDDCGYERIISSDTPGGDTPGGDTPGGDTPGGDTPGTGGNFPPVINPPVVNPPEITPPEITPPEIVKQPTDQYVAEGQQAEFTTEANGDDITYQWYIDRNDGKGWRELEGATGTTYITSITDLDCDGFRYYCKVTDKHGNTLQSDTAILFVSPLPVLPETGDASTPLLWLTMSVLSILGMAIMKKKVLTR